MTTVKMNCPKCGGYGLTGTVQEVVCTQCAGKGTISVNDADTLSTINAASSAPIVISVPTSPPAAAVKTSQKGK